MCATCAGYSITLHFWHRHLFSLDHPPLITKISAVWLFSLAISVSFLMENATVQVPSQAAPRPQNRSHPAKRWCFTLNLSGLTNAAEFEDGFNAFLSHCEPLVDAGAITYLIAGREVAETGTYHIQGYLELSTKKRLTFLKTKVSNRAHWEVSRGTPEEASVYCQKDGLFREYGVLSSSTSNQGHRSDLMSAKAALDAGTRLSEFADLHFPVFIRYQRSLTVYKSLRSVKRSWKTEVFVYWGKTGTGKTRAVVESEPDLYIAVDTVDFCWFDGFEGQEAVLFDDIVHIPGNRYGLLLKLLDRYPLTVPSKGSFVNWNPKKIYFTSNVEWKHWNQGIDDETLAALERRIENVKFFE